MPQASPELQAQWPGFDSEALAHIEPNFTIVGGVIQPKESYSPTARDFSAIAYLCDEWDYGYSGERGVV